ncbi:MAG: hypothetical protein ACTSYX_05580 [Candidatus Thorarchaeota archaeon]
MIGLPRLPGQEKSPSLIPPVLPRTTVPTPFGTVHLPEQQLLPPKPPPMNTRTAKVMAHAIAIDASMVVAGIPYVGDVIADVVEDLHFAELRNMLSPAEYSKFIKHDKVAPATVAMLKAVSG